MVDDELENPVADPDSDEELAALGAVETPDVDIDEPAEPAAEAEEEPADRGPKSSRRAGKKEPKGNVNLDDYEEFRKWKADADTRVAEAQKAAEEARRRQWEAEQAAEQYRQYQEQAQLQQLNAQLDEAIDPNERAAYIRQIAQIEAQGEYQKLMRWETWKREQVAASGFDPFDPRFQKAYQSAAEFQLDLAKAENERLRREAADAKKASSPEAITAEVKRQVAKALQSAGMNRVDVAAPQATPDDGEALARDIKLLNSGKLSGKAFTDKWGKR